MNPKSIYYTPNLLYYSGSNTRRLGLPIDHLERQMPSSYFSVTFTYTVSFEQAINDLDTKAIKALLIVSASLRSNQLIDVLNNVLVTKEGKKGIKSATKLICVGGC